MDTEKLFNSEKEDKLILSFNKILKQFLNELHKVFPEYNIIKLKEYKNLDDKDDRFLLYYMTYIEKDIEKIFIGSQIPLEPEWEKGIREIVGSDSEKLDANSIITVDNASGKDQKMLSLSYYDAAIGAAQSLL